MILKLHVARPDPSVSTVFVLGGPVGGVTVNSIAKWNGTQWSALGTGAVGPIPTSAAAVNGMGVYNEQQISRGDPPVTAWEFVRTPQFWFESFQNWQSEFLSIGAMVVLTIFLREKDSPESKRVETPHSEHDD